MKCSVDRIEEGIAVIIIRGGGRMEIPEKKFPFKIKEGDFLDVTFSPDRAEKQRVKKNISAIRKRLLKRSQKK
ncbi:MAG: DUF3006 domain-containing protein [Elusimicrobiota bacterium]|nr:DUF3006 domain-containing protein [Elusimicrobiota bacterium]